MKCNQVLKLLFNGGWFIHSQKGSHIKLRHPIHTNTIIFPNHGSKELGKGLMIKLLKEAKINP